MSGPTPGGRRPDERAYARVQYPSHRRPYLVIAGEICEVVDCSEVGLRYGSSVDQRPVGTLVSGQLCLRSGATVDIRGKVVRIQDGEVALVLEPGHGIPAAVIAAEAAALAS